MKHDCLYGRAKPSGMAASLNGSYLAVRRGTGAWNARRFSVPVYASTLTEFSRDFGGDFSSAERSNAFHAKHVAAEVTEIVRLVNLSSEYVTASWPDVVGLLWIDGDHRYKAVKRDLACWLPHLRPDATIIFHDATNPKIGPCTRSMNCLPRDCGARNSSRQGVRYTADCGIRVRSQDQEPLYVLRRRLPKPPCPDLPILSVRPIYHRASQHGVLRSQERRRGNMLEAADRAASGQEPPFSSSDDVALCRQGGELGRSLSASTYCGYAAVIFYFYRIDVYDGHFFDAAYSPVYNIARVIFGLYLFALLYVTGDDVIASINGSRKLR